MKIFIATKNKHKLIELERILKPMGFDVLSEIDFNGNFPDVEENGETFAENALIKAKNGLINTGLISVADDSGLCVDYLGGKPGIYTARYAGVPTDDNKNIDKLLSELKGVEKSKRTAKFVSAIACVFPDGRQFTVTGECNGYIAEKRLGENGFGYDPVFISEKGCFATISPEDKDSVSHRGKATKKFRDEIKKYL
ncbi:MAG: RdgB/HAM1 family non-canonical purine NTP pyrophosphatase [Clostridia bacterium]|nr:RdgB/HAM1 family non-canonical purine NTP pyrophosphatase [Clostridia bacterium]